jgi:hypothetical protein
MPVGVAPSMSREISSPNFDGGIGQGLTSEALCHSRIKFADNGETCLVKQFMNIRHLVKQGINSHVAIRASDIGREAGSKIRDQLVGRVNQTKQRLDVGKGLSDAVCASPAVEG